MTLDHSYKNCLAVGMLSSFLVILIFGSFQCFAQSDRIISSQELQQDFWVYRKSLEEAHPGLYWYKTKTQMDSIFDSAREQLDQPMSERNFFSLLSWTTARIGCLHTYMKGSKAFEKANINPEARPFPFDIIIDQDRMFIHHNLSNDLSIPDGVAITSINGQETSLLIRFLTERIPNDGFGDHWSRYVLERSFRYFYHVLLGASESFEITLKNAGGKEWAATAPGRLEKERSKIIRERYPNSVLEDPVISLKFDEQTNSAILRVTRFDNWKIGKKKYKFRKVLKEKMKEVLASEVANLVLDVGDHGGGNELWGLELLSYFLDEPYTAYQAVEFKTFNYDISKKYSSTSWLEMNLVKLILNFEKSDSTINLKNYKGVKPYPPRKQQFKGNLYLLIGGSTASATSDFASWVKELDLATIVGTETGGSHLGNTSNWEFMVELPNTKLRLHLPLARYIINDQMKELGRGVIPDYIVPTTTLDKLNNVDAQLNYALELIRNKTMYEVPKN
ncbi:MAG: S41 family peptidase [Bacteroidota bacterium]